MSTAKKTAADKAAQQFEAAAAGKETMDTVVKASGEAAARNYEKLAAMTREQVDATFKAGAETFKSVEGYDHMAAIGKDNVDAVFASGAVLAKGAQDFSRIWFGLAQASLDQGVEATRKMLACKSVEDVLEVQSGLAADGYGRLVSEGQKLSGMSLKLAEEAAQPIAGRMGAAVEQFTKQPAA